MLENGWRVIDQHCYRTMYNTVIIYPKPLKPFLLEVSQRRRKSNNVMGRYSICIDGGIDRMVSIC